MTEEESRFREEFLRLTGKEPLQWQWRLFRDYFSKGLFPAIVDLPTGLGKTMVMAIWLIARAQRFAVPTRLIYVVDRRTVVDQATDLAVQLVKNWEKETGFQGEPPAISTLRGQLADNRQWSRDPSRPAIVIGTVDLIGSALLFSGYRSSYKRRPLEAGLLGQDSLLVLDEAHLARPFEKLVRSISDFQKPDDKPIRVIRMSATSSDGEEDNRFKLEQTDLVPEIADRDGKLAANPVVERFNAKKRLTIVTRGEKEKLTDKLAAEAIKLAQDNTRRGKRIVVFVRRPDAAKTVAKAIREHVIESVDESGAKPKRIRNTPYSDSVEVLTGTMRGLERDRLVERLVFQERWLKGDLDPSEASNQQPVFLVSTSAGEVGFDLNADHLVGDEAPLDSWIQRLGRVNRRGKGDATVLLIREKAPVGKTDFEKACAATTDLLSEHLDGEDVGPQSLAAFRKTLTLERIETASSPRPTMVALTDILLDAWSMTSIRERMPGRPEVGPWLRGIDNEQAQTTIAWRAELELFCNVLSPEKALQATFTKHPIRPHESLTVNTGHLLDFLKMISKLKDRTELLATRVAVRLPRGQIVCRTIQQLNDDPGILYADSTLILPATFGGLDSSGMLDAESIPKARHNGDPEPPSIDDADHPDYEQREDASPRLRLIARRTDDGEWIPESLPGGAVLSDRLQLKPVYPTSTKLFDDLRKRDLRIRLVQPIEFNEEGVAVQSLVMLSPIASKGKSSDQLLDKHVGAVEAEAERIADALGLAKDDPLRVALLFAAKWHDEGKKAVIWQRFVYGPDADGQFKGKSSKSRDPKSLRGYRHEFGSLLRIHHSDRCDTTGCVLPTDPDTRDLALHLIATHHGAGRPHFGPGQYHPFTTTEAAALHTDSIRRFARLQRKYGWWRLAWLEDLLRCADALASADQDSEDDPSDLEGITE